MSETERTRLFGQTYRYKISATGVFRVRLLLNPITHEPLKGSEARKSILVWYESKCPFCEEIGRKYTVAAKQMVIAKQVNCSHLVDFRTENICSNCGDEMGKERVSCSICEAKGKLASARAWAVFGIDPEVQFEGEVQSESKDIQYVETTDADWNEDTSSKKKSHFWSRSL